MVSRTFTLTSQFQGTGELLILYASSKADLACLFHFWCNLRLGIALNDDDVVCDDAHADNFPEIC